MNDYYTIQINKIKSLIKAFNKTDDDVKKFYLNEKITRLQRRLIQDYMKGLDW